MRANEAFGPIIRTIIQLLESRFSDTSGASILFHALHLPRRGPWIRISVAPTTFLAWFGPQHEYKIVLGAGLLATAFAFVAAIRGSKWRYVGVALSSATLAFFTYSLSV